MRYWKFLSDILLDFCEASGLISTDRMKLDVASAACVIKISPHKNDFTNKEYEKVPLAIGSSRLPAAYERLLKGTVAQLDLNQNARAEETLNLLYVY